MSRVIAAFAQFFDDQGDPVENGWLRFLVSATNNTDKETYSDANQTVANANPLQLDAAGRCPNVYGQGKYRVVLFENNPVTNLPGSQLAEFDPVFAQVITQSAGENFSEWDVDVTYEVGSIVSYQHSYYRSFTSGNLGNFPDSSPTEWEQISFLRYYNSSVSYYTDDIVVYNSQFYFSLADANQGNQPDISPAWWDALGSGTILTNWEENGTDFRPTAAGYNIGDAVNYVGTMYLDAFGIFPETPAALPTADYEVANKLYVDTLRDDVMKWQSDWSPGTYETYDVVRDDQWTMIANTTTEERPAPQPVGDAIWVRDEYSPPAFSSTSASENVLYIGQRYLYVPAYLTTHIRVYFPAAAVGLNVELWAVIDPTGDKRILNLVPGQTLTAADVDKWIELSPGQAYVTENTTIDFIMVVRPSTGTVTFTHEWIYSKTNGDPGAGEIYHQGGSSADEIRVHEQDNTLTDRTSELDNIGPGSTIHMASSDYTWEVLQASKTGDIYTFTVDPAARAGNATTDFEFLYIGTTAINYVYNTNLYASESRISGYFANEYDPTNATYIDNNGYGLDIQIQNVITSADWEVVATPPGFGFISSAGGGSGLTYWEEVGDIFRPVTTKVGQLGDATHLIESLFVMDSGVIYLGDSQDLEIKHDGIDSWLENNTGDLYLQNSSSNSIFLTANSNSWELASNGDIIPDTTAAYDFGSTTFRIDKGWFTSLEITNTPTINGADFITTVLPSQVGHSGEYLQTDGAGNLSWAAAGGGSGLVYWEEIIEVLRPKTTKVGQLGDSTHLIENAYYMDGGKINLGDSQEMYLTYTGLASEIYSTVGTLTLASNDNALIFVANGSQQWRIDTAGVLRPYTTNTNDIGTSTYCVNDAYFGDNSTIYLGDSQDATIAFDGTDLAITGSGDLLYNTNVVYHAGNDSGLVHIAGIETISGIKEYSSGLRLSNNIIIQGRILSTALRDIIGIDSSDNFKIGNTSCPVLFNSNGTISLISSNLEVDNDNRIKMYDSLNNARDVFYITATDIINIANINHSVNIRSNGTLTHNSVDMITSLLPAQATHAGEFLTTDGAGTLSWAAVSGSLSAWEESGTTFRPTTSGYDLGDTTHLVGDAYFGDSGTIYLGTGQDMSIFHDGSDGNIITAGPLYLDTSDASGINFRTNSTARWRIDSNGILYPATTNTYNLGNATFCINDAYFGDNGTIYFGDDQDLEIRHPGTGAVIYNNTGILFFGTTTANGVNLRTNSTNRWIIDSSGHWIPGADNTYNMGESGTTIGEIWSLGVYNTTTSARDVYVDATGQLGYLTSAARAKENIEEMPDTEWIYDLDPKMFNYINDPENRIEYGLIADEVEKIRPELVFYDVDEDGNKEIAGINYRCFNAILINEIKKLNNRIKILEAV